MVQMFSFSRNAYVVIDGDRGKSHFERAKERITTEWRQLAKCRPDMLGLWYDQTGKVKTIEDYISHQGSRDLLVRKKKLKNARDCVLLWDALSLADFAEDLPQRIEDLYNKISAWGN